MAAPLVRQYDFRGRYDNGTETGAGWIALIDTDWTQDVDTVFRVRFQISEYNNGNAGYAYHLRYSTGGAYAAVTGSTPIQYTTSSQSIADTDPTTEQMGGAQTFQPGEYSEDGLTEIISGLKSEDTELEFCLTIDAAQVTDEDTITLQVYSGVSDPMDIYDNTPIITVNKAPVGTAYNRTNTDNAGLNTVVLRKVTSPRTETDNLGLNTNAIRTVTAPRVSTDNLGLADNVLAGCQKARTNTDNLGLSDNVEQEHLIAGTLFERENTDNLGLSDDVTRTVTAPRTATDNLGLSDDVSRTVTAPRVATDNLGLADNVLQQKQTPGGTAHPRTATDNAGLNTPALSAIRETDQQFDGDTLGLSDNVEQSVDVGGGGVSVDRTATDNLGLSDNVTRSVVAPRTEADNLGLTDDVTRTVTAPRTTTDNLGLADNVEQAYLHAPVSFDRTNTDNLGLSDNVVQQHQTPGGSAINRTATDNLGLQTDIVEQYWLWYYPNSVGSIAYGTRIEPGEPGTISSGDVRSLHGDDGTRLVITEEVGNYPSGGFQMDFLWKGIPQDWFKVTFNGFYSGNPAHNIKIYAFNNDTTNYDALTADANDFPSAASDQDYEFFLPEPFADYIDSGTVRIRIKHTSTGVAGHTFNIDNLRLDHAAIRRTVTDNLGLADNTTRSLEAARTATDNLGLADNAIRAAVLARTLIDTLALTDNVTAARAAGQAVTDNLGLADQITVSRAAAEIVSDTLGLSDNVARALIAGRTLTTPLGLLDQITVAVEYGRAVSDTLGLDTDTTAAGGVVVHERTSTDNLGLSDVIIQQHVKPEKLTFTLSAAQTYLDGAKAGGTYLDGAKLAETYLDGAKAAQARPE